jgi:hypothetical protein
MRGAGLEPIEPFPGVVKPWRCRCMKCGNVVSPRLDAVRNGIGCRFCAERGIDYAAPGIVYLLHHQGLGAYKVGIANQTSNRTQQFASGGWTTFRTLPMDTADEAFRVEQAVLAPYRGAFLCPYLSAAELQNGFTETIDAEAVTILDLWAEVVAAARTVDPLS